MAKFTLTAVKGTDFNANLEMEATPAEVAQMLVSSRETMKDMIALFGEAKVLAKEFYDEFKPILQRRAAAALDRDGSSWVREEEEKALRHEIEMEKLRNELAELRARATEKATETTLERIVTMNENMGTRLNEVISHNNQTEDTSTNSIVARIPNDGDFSHRVSTTTGNETSSGVRVVRIGDSEIHARRIAETTATTRDRD